MARARICLLACSMLLGVVMAWDPRNPNEPIPRTLLGYAYQCQTRGPNFPGACSSQNVGARSGFRCDKIYCAYFVSRDNFVAVETGKALDGTECRRDHWCINGECVRAENARIPRPSGPGPNYVCQDPPKISAHGSNRGPTSAPIPPARMPPRSTASNPSASKPSTSTSSGTRTQYPNNRAPVNPTAESPSKRRKTQ